MGPLYVAKLLGRRIRQIAVADFRKHREVQRGVSFRIEVFLVGVPILE
jgi:hypothetical protein